MRLAQWEELDGRASHRRLLPHAAQHLRMKQLLRHVICSARDDREISGPRDVAHVISTTGGALAEAGVCEPGREAHILVASALACEPTDLPAMKSQPVITAVLEKVGQLVRRRVAGEPLAYVTGAVDFRGLRLRVDARVMIPGSSVLVEVGLREESGARVHDIGTGCGAIALALKAERPDLAVSGSDIADDAIDVARANAGRLGLDVPFVVSDGIPTSERYDLVLASLPYLTPTQCASHPMLARQPRGAITTGNSDPLATIQHVLERAHPGQRIALQHPLSLTSVIRDLLDASTTEGRENVPTATVGRVRRRH